jgi:hypothetical protein
MEIKGDGEVRAEGAGTQTAAPAPSTPAQCPLPTCRSKEIDKLNQLGGFQLWQCRKCQHEWKTPVAPASIVTAPPEIPDELRADEPCAMGCGEGFRYPPAKKAHEAGCRGRRTPETGRKAKERTVAKLTCEKCPEETFKNPQALGAHRRYIHDGAGTTRRAPKERAASPRKTSTPPAAPAASALRGGGGPAVRSALADLRERRAEILAGIPELQKVDAAIVALEALGGQEEARKDPS